jgi:hypothetical protein
VAAATKERKFHRFQLEEVVKGVGAMDLPQASAAKATGDGRIGRATAAAI